MDSADSDFSSFTDTTASEHANTRMDVVTVWGPCSASDVGSNEIHEGSARDP